MIRQNDLEIEKPFSSDMANRNVKNNNNNNNKINEYQAETNPYEVKSYFTPES